MNNKVNEKGRPSKYDEKTVTVGMRVPVSKVGDFKQKAKEILKAYSDPNAELQVKPLPDNFAVGKKVGECGCKLLGKSPTGKEIWQRCSTHKNVK